MSEAEIEILSGLSFDIKVLMYDGSVKPIHQIKVNDIMMGDDSTPRNVINVKTIDSSQTNFFKVYQNKGTHYVINRDNYISLKLSRVRNKTNTIKIKEREYFKNDIVDIRLQDYLTFCKTSQLDFKGFKVMVEFSPQPVALDPYILGLWLVDAMTLTTNEIAISDVSILHECYTILQHNRMTLEFSKGNRYSIHYDDKAKSFHDVITVLGLSESKFIPETYKINSKEVRLKLLAGIIDCEGTVNKNCYELTLKNETLANDIMFLSNSLGFYTSKSTQKNTFYIRLIISGDLSQLPVLDPKKVMPVRKQIKNILHTGIAIESTTDTNSCLQISLDGNGRFLSSDFTVLHC
jgi:replicative DNA helicase